MKIMKTNKRTFINSAILNDNVGKIEMYGDVYEETYSFVIPEDAPKGEYAIRLTCYVDDFGGDHPENTGHHSKIFEGFITVK